MRTKGEKGANRSKIEERVGDNIPLAAQRQRGLCGLSRVSTVRDKGAYAAKHLHCAEDLQVASGSEVKLLSL